MDVQILIIILVILIPVGLVILKLLVSKPDASWKNTLRLELGKLAKQAQANPNNSAIIVHADKLFDHALKKRLIKGNTMSERLIAAKPKFDKQLYQQIWDAHKARNKIAHEVGFNIPGAEISRHFRVYQKAIRAII